jgi:hypothetical protein
MDAPEKIYLHPDIGDREFIRPLLKNRANQDSVEYTRTDVFIEKARKWFERQNEWRDINGIKHCDMESFEDFKKYIDGE